MYIIFLIHMIGSFVISTPFQLRALSLWDGWKTCLFQKTVYHIPRFFYCDTRFIFLLRDFLSRCILWIRDIIYRIIFHEWIRSKVLLHISIVKYITPLIFITSCLFGISFNRTCANSRQPFIFITICNKIHVIPGVSFFPYKLITWIILCSYSPFIPGIFQIMRILLQKLSSVSCARCISWCCWGIYGINEILKLCFCPMFLIIVINLRLSKVCLQYLFLELCSIRYLFHFNYWHCLTIRQFHFCTYIYIYISNFCLHGKLIAVGLICTKILYIAYSTFCQFFCISAIIYLFICTACQWCEDKCLDECHNCCK